jgi:hypothetical protein
MQFQPVARFEPSASWFGNMDSVAVDRRLIPAGGYLTDFTAKPCCQKLTHVKFLWIHILGGSRIISSRAIRAQ